MSSHHENPYAPPLWQEAPPPEPLSTAQVKARLRGPAIGLIASSVWGAGLALFLGATVILEKVNRLPRLTLQDQHELATCLAMLLAFLLVALSIARGALAMLNRSDLFAARNAALLAIFPCSGASFVGLPFGIWALWVLHDPRVRSQFRGRLVWSALLRPQRGAAAPPG